MVRKFQKSLPRFERDSVIDVLGGVWLVTLMLSLLHLPALIA